MDLVDFKKACDKAGISMNPILITTREDNAARESGSLRINLGPGFCSDKERHEMNFMGRVPGSLMRNENLKIGTIFRDGESEFRKWICVLSCDGKVWDVKYRTGISIAFPTREDVISSLFSDSRCAEENFNGFCSSLGYERDSRKALKTWKECRKNARKLRWFIPPGHYKDIEELANEY